MVKQGQGGKIVNFSSQAGRRGEALVAGLCASKAQSSASLSRPPVSSSMESTSTASPLASSIRRCGIASMPSCEVREPAARAKRNGRSGLAVPYGRMGLPADMVGAAVFLASADAD